MLVMSATEDTELERWHTLQGGCRLSEKQRKSKKNLETVLNDLPRVMSLLLRMRIRANGALGALSFEADEIELIQASSELNLQQIMSKLLDVGAALAQGGEEADQFGAVVESLSGGLYIGAPLAWKGEGIKYSVHAIQAAVMNAWHHGETQIKSVMSPVEPCACCRQFLRETWSWNTMRVLVVADDRLLHKGTDLEGITLNLQGIRTDGIKARLLGELKRATHIGKTSAHDLALVAADATAQSYAPYSKNYAGVAIKTKNGAVHQGRCAETLVPSAGVTAIEDALIDLVLSARNFAEIDEVVLVEYRGSNTQFSATQKLCLSMGSIPFRFTMVSS